MSNQDRLLSDEEILAELMFGKKTYTGYTSGENFSVNGFLSRESAEKLLDIINTQKRLYAEMVVGRPWPIFDEPDAHKAELNQAKNELISEQRARIK